MGYSRKAKVDICSECGKRISREQNKSHGICVGCLARTAPAQNVVQDILPRLLSTEDEWDTLEKYAKTIQEPTPLPYQLIQLTHLLAQLQLQIANEIHPNPLNIATLVKKSLSVAAALEVPLASLLRKQSTEVIRPLSEAITTNISTP